MAELIERIDADKMLLSSHALISNRCLADSVSRISRRDALEMANERNVNYVYIGNTFCAEVKPSSIKPNNYTHHVYFF